MKKYLLAALFVATFSPHLVAQSLKTQKINESTYALIGEIGGSMEAEAARWVKATGNKKPVVGFIAGQTAPKGRTMGHAGAIVGGKDDTAQAKMEILRENGIHVVESPAKIGEKVAEILGKLNK